MKNIFVLNLIFLVAIVFLQFFPLQANSCDDPCDDLRSVVNNLKSSYEEARLNVDELRIAESTIKGQALAGNDQTDPLSKKIEEAMEATDAAAERATELYNQWQAKDRELLACMMKYHPCSGCGCLIESEGITGHRSLLCSANHTYYECNSSDVWTHTTYLNCPVGGESLLACVLNSHQHDVRCSGCQNQYNAMSSDEGYHRLRYCTYCYQSFRNCDRPRGTCSSGINQGLPHSD